MIGQYQHGVDAKGRLFIPAKFREELGKTFYVTRGQDHCLSVFSEENWQRLTARLSDLPYTEVKKLRRFFSNAAECEPDAQGRILLPQSLREYAGLEKDAVIIGMLNRAEIWSAANWNAEDENEDEVVDFEDALKAFDAF